MSAYDYVGYIFSAFIVLVISVTVYFCVENNNYTNVRMAEQGYCAADRIGTSSAKWTVCR